MTGRYAHNTGLSFAMFPGSVAGLPPDMATLPQLLREAGYAAHMVGKWHLGHAQWAQTLWAAAVAGAGLGAVSREQIVRTFPGAAARHPGPH